MKLLKIADELHCEIKMSDKLVESIENLSGSLPTARLGLSLEQKIELIQKLGGPRTVGSILKCKKDYPLKRIPFMFSKLDTQAIVDVLANEMEEALQAYRRK